MDRMIAGIPQPGVVDRRQVRLDDRRLEILGEIDALHVDAVEIEGLPGGIDISMDVRPLGGELVGLHLEVLDDRRVDGADDERDERPQADRDHGQHPAASPDVPDEQRRGDDRHEDQEVQRGELCLDVGVARTVDDAAVGEVELEAREVVLGGLHERHDRHDHREVRLHLRRHPLQRALEPDAAVEVVRDRGDEQHDDETGEEPVDHELDERQLEDVEADVLVELRVRLMPNLTRFVNRIHCRHCDETPIPAIRAKNSETPTRIRPRKRAGGLLVPGDELVLRRRRGHRRGSAARAGRR